MNANESTRSPLSSLARAIAKFWTQDLLPLLADLRLAIGLLLAIAVFSIAGTVIEQGQTLAFYQENYPEDPALFGFLTWKVVLLIGLNSVYRTWWFLALLILFGSSLTACTFTRQWPALKAARGWTYYRQPRQFEKLALSARLDRVVTNPLGAAGDRLKGQGYRIYRDGDVVYARKGIVGRIGPIVVHAAMLIVLGGAIVGAATGFLAQEMVPSGQTFQVRNLLDAGPWSESQVPTDWAVKVNRFWIDYTPDGNIDQFYSDLSVVDLDGQERDRQTIHVNKPLRYGGITMYQTDWGISAVRLHVNNSPPLELPMALLPVEGGRIWGTWVPTNADFSDGVSLVTKDLQGTLLIYDKTGKPVATTRVGRSVQVNGATLAVEELLGSTGLQIKADPGIPIVYGGFGLLMLGVVLSYFSHSQVWLLKTADGLYIGGRTNRAQVAFERELVAAIDALELPPSATPAVTSAS